MRPLQSNRWHIAALTQCSRCKQHETENSSVCSWMKQSNARVSSRSAVDSKHGVRQQRNPFTNLPTCSWYDQVTVTRWTQRRPWSNVRGGRQQAGNVCTRTQIFATHRCLSHWGLNLGYAIINTELLTQRLCCVAVFQEIYRRALSLPCKWCAYNKHCL